MSTAVTFWIPDLLHPNRVEEAKEILAEGRFSFMRQLLSKADFFSSAEQSFYQTACQLFHQPHMHPIAATMASVELNKFQREVFWLKVDPVQMVADRDTLVLFPGKDLTIEEDESKALIQAFNDHFSEDRVFLEYATPESWYLQIVQPVDIQTHSLDAVAYQSLTDKLPKGNAATYWRQLMNEVQMLFFSHPVNESRRDKGLPEINSIWIWGEGILKEQGIHLRPDAKIWSKHAYLKGLSQTTHSGWSSFPENHQAWEKSNRHQEYSHHLILLDQVYQNLDDYTIDEWLDVLEKIEDQWLKGFMDALSSKQIHSLLIDFGSGKRYHLEPKHLNRFWRWKKPFGKLIRY